MQLPAPAGATGLRDGGGGEGGRRPGSGGDRNMD